MDIVDLPSKPRDEVIRELREGSRKLVREFGFMRATLADSGMAPSAVHAIIEIGLAPGIQARDLASLLRLDKSNTSRQIAKLESLGLLARQAVTGDARSSQLVLTDAGQKLRQQIDRFAADQVASALQQLTSSDQQMLARSLSLYANALAHDNNSNSNSPGRMPARDESIHAGYQPGCIGDVAGLHARFYTQAAGFGVFFESKVATEFAAFAQALPSPGKALWLYLENDRSLASLAIDGNEQTGVAHLRWFIVDESLRGSGIGRQLLERALAFVDSRFEETYLWTFKGLTAARHLYESSGFRLTDEAEGVQWGTAVIEQRFSRRSRKARH